MNLPSFVVRLNSKCRAVALRLSAATKTSGRGLTKLVTGLVVFLEMNAYARFIRLLIAAFGFAVVVGTAYQILIDLDDRQIQRSALKSQLVMDAWSRLTMPGIVNNGRAAALNYLHRAGEPFDGLDLSCKSLVLGWDAEKKSCKRRPYMTGMRIGDFSNPFPKTPSYYQKKLRYDEENLKIRKRSETIAMLGTSMRPWNEPASEYWSIYNIDFSDNNIKKSTLMHGDIDAILKRTRIILSNIEGSTLRGIFENTSISFSNLASARLEGDLSGLSISHSNLSGTFFDDDIPSDQISLSWAWADTPPVMHGDLNDYDILLCDPIIRPMVYAFPNELPTEKQDVIDKTYKIYVDELLAILKDSSVWSFPEMFYTDRLGRQWSFACVDVRSERRKKVSRL